LAIYQRGKVYLFHVLKALEDAQPEELLSSVQQAGDLFLSVIKACSTGGSDSNNLERKVSTTNACFSVHFDVCVCVCVCGQCV
jgi:hypothetical protein